MPFGLTSAPATFQRLMNTVFSSMLWHNVMVYLDDIVVYTDTWQDHLAALDEVFLRLRSAGLKASPSKCEIAQEQLLCPRHIILREGTSPDPANIKVIVEAQPPASVTQVRSFIGITIYYGDYVEWYAALAKPLYDMLKKNAAFTWSVECDAAFQQLKGRLTSPPVLRRPDTSLPYILHTVWSPAAIGAVLSQNGEDQQEHPLPMAAESYMEQSAITQLLKESA